MHRKNFICAALALLLISGLAAGVGAAEVDCDAVYCFSPGDFSTTQEEALTGICITGLPEPASGTVMLGSRVLQTGDILTAGQVEEMTFHPLRTEQDCSATVSYLPIYENRVEQTAQMTLSIRGKEDKAPVAQDSSLETYKNLPNEGKLSVTDPEGQQLTYTLVRKPKRGTVEIREDGTFTYTPKKNKVGVDSFTYTATDPAGKVSREATVTIQILKPTDSKQYKDTVGLSCRFEAEWMKNAGLFTGEKISGQSCFQPEKTVSRGEFLAMTIQALDIPTDDTDYSAIPSDTPQWLKPYVAAALRAGLTDGIPELESCQQTITGAEAAVILQNALDLSAEEEAVLAEDIPQWAALSVSVMAYNGMEVCANEALTRADVAQMLYRASQLAPTAPGTAVFRMQ